MDQEPGFHNRGHHIALKISSLLIFLTNHNTPSDYNNITPKIEFWIEYALREGFTTVDELVKGVSCVAWDRGGSCANVGRFLKEFRDAPQRSEQAVSFVDKFCEHVLRWFSIASAENLNWASGSVARRGANGFIRAASLVGYLIECGLLSRELVRRHLVKPLIAHHYTGDKNAIEETVRAKAMYRLFLAAGSTLLRGLLDPEDVQVCFEILDTQLSLGTILGFDAEKLKELREIHTTWLGQKEKEEQRHSAGTGEHEGEEGKHMLATEVPAEIETPVAFNPRDLPTPVIDLNIPSSITLDVEPSETFVNISHTALSSPTSSISTVSDLTLTELGEETERNKEQAATRHDIFYFEDGNVEVVCGATVFRVHSTVISFSSPKLRDILSPSTLLNAPMLDGCPRIVLNGSAEDFAVLLKMIYTPGFPARYEVPKFGVFASLLRMTTKYGFSDVRDQLLRDLRAAYPTRWEAYQAAEVLGEDVFGSPKPHPNAVLDLFATQNVRFAIPFAAYRASLGGFSSLVNNESGTVLLRHTLASTIHGRGEILRMMTQAAHTISHKEKLFSVCPEKTCFLNVSIKSMEYRMEVLAKLHEVMIGEREGGVLSSPSWGDLACAKCEKEIEASHTAWRKACWEVLPATFSVAKRWDEV